MYSNGKGISSSALPYRRKAPRWVTLDSNSIVELIVSKAKKGSVLYVYLYIYI